MNVLDFSKAKLESRKLTMVTCYDYVTAQLIEQSPIDCVLVGDSVAMVMHGHPTTLNATIEMMELHTAAVARGLETKFIVGDMPFLSFRKGPQAALECVERLMRAGAHAVKLEGVRGHEETIERIVQSGVPVMGHIGLTPQSVHGLGGYRVQGRQSDAALELEAQARKLQDLGCFSVVLECVPSELGARITKLLSIPTIGIGAGPSTDGQVLVVHDLVGMTSGRVPKFVRRFASTDENIVQALKRFSQETIEGSFPKNEEGYS